MKTQQNVSLLERQLRYLENKVINGFKNIKHMYYLHYMYSF